MNCCQITATAMASTANGPTVVANLRARPRTSSVVFRARYTPPWVRNSSSVVMPMISANGLSRVKKLPVNSCCASIGTPRTMFPNATPHSSASSQEVIRIDQSQRARHTSECPLPRYSNATPRTIRQTRISSSAR